MKISQLNTGTLLWVGIEGPSLSYEEKKFLQTEHISGVVLFQRNIISPQQLHTICQEIHSVHPTIFISIDREGGPVDRLKHLEMIPSWPSPGKLIQVASSEDISSTAFFMGRELAALGIDINLAPSLDIEHVPSTLFKDRLFGAKAKDIIEKGLAWMQGLQRSEVLPCAKHFPGHGAVLQDSHKMLPIDLWFV